MRFSLLLLVLVAQAAQGATALLPSPSAVSYSGGEWMVPRRIELLMPDRCRAVAESAVGLCSDPALRARVRFGTGAGSAWTLRSAGMGFPAPPAATEAYRLNVTSRGVALAAVDEAGFRYGVLTLMQLLSSSRKVPACEIDDRPALGLRAVMIDMVRLKERDEVYFSMLEEIAAWKMNALFLHFTDSDGCSIELKSHPEVVTRNAMTQETLKRLITRGKQLGVRVIPEVEAWGHAAWATRPHPDFSEAGRGSFCLSNEAIYPFLEDVIREVAGLFPDPYIHVGCDEATYAACEKCKAQAASDGEEKLISTHINRLNRIVRKLGKTSVVWGDIILRSRKLLSMLDSDIIVENWDYKKNVGSDKLAMLCEEKRLAIAGPSLMCGGYRICPAMDNFDNTLRFCEHAKTEQAGGVATTIWLPQRYVPGSLGLGLAWAAAHSWNPGAMSLEDVAASYLANRFGLDPTAERAARMARLVDVGQKEGTLTPAFWWKIEKLVSLATSETHAETESYATKVRGIEKGFASDLLSVRFNRPEFESIVLAAACGEHLLNRREVGARVVGLVREARKQLEAGSTQEASKTLADAAKSVRRLERERSVLVRRMQDQWLRDRYADDGERFGRGVGGGHVLMWWFGSKDTNGYADYLATRLEELSAKPDATALDVLIP